MSWHRRSMIVLLHLQYKPMRRLSVEKHLMIFIRAPLDMPKQISHVTTCIREIFGNAC